MCVREGGILRCAHTRATLGPRLAVFLAGAGTAGAARAAPGSIG